MSNSENELDIAGIGKIAEAIPKKGWKKIIDTACDTFTDLIAPITRTTAGLGGLIQAKFDTMIGVQKVFAADAVYRARVKIENAGASPNPRPSARVLVTSIEQASVESDDSLRDIWANLIANEMSSGHIHPEFPSILSRMSAEDAVVLSKIAEKSTNKSILNNVRAFSNSMKVFTFSVGDFLSDSSDAHHEHLKHLALIKRTDGLWELTHFGEEFVRAVTYPAQPSGGLDLHT